MLMCALWIALAQAPTADSPVPYLGFSEPLVSAAQINVDILALKRMRPGIGGPIGLLVAGGGVFVGGALYTALGLLVRSTQLAFLALGIGGMVIGAPFLIVGTWLLVNRIPERARIDREIESLKRELTMNPARVEADPMSPVGPWGLTLVRI